jgi:hypothetical protein
MSTKNDTFNKLINTLSSIFKKIVNANWNKPKNILLLIAALVAPFAAWQYVATGLVLGLLKALSILFVLDKSPDFIKDLVVKYPLFADVFLTGLTLVVIGGYFGAGLTLGIGAAFAMLILSWALPVFGEQYLREKMSHDKESFAAGQPAY